MARVCIYLQLHQPHRLRRYSVFDTQTDYFDDKRNAKLVTHAAEVCYLPATKLLLDLVKKHDSRFRFAICVSGCVVDQLKQQSPEVIELLQTLAQTGCVEFLSETYHHSLAFLYSRDEFKNQIDLHTKLMEDLVGQTPTVFRNTELIYNNELASYLRGLDQHRAVLVQPIGRALGDRPPTHLYHPPGMPEIKLLLKNDGLTDDVVVRFSNPHWNQFPLTADKYTRWISQIADPNIVNLFMELETLGLIQPEDTGIFDFFAHLPDQLLKAGENTFVTPSQLVDTTEPSDEYDDPHATSWADTDRDLSPWLGNAMQSSAMLELYKLEADVKAAGNPALLDDWRNLTSSDHFYYMSTKYFANGHAHTFFNPYESPYDAYINFMNVLDNLRSRVEGNAPIPTA